MVEAGTSSQKPPERWWTREVARSGDLVKRVRALVYRILDTVPPVRRSVDELVRIEVIDRSMAIGAQALLALVPMVLVLAAFLPHAVTGVGLERIQDVTGLGDVGTQLTRGVTGSTSGSGPDVDQVRTTTGYVGLLITLLSATSFGRAVQRLYERVWEQKHLGGVAGLRRSLGWLLAWLVAMQLVSFVGFLFARVDEPVLEPVFWGIRAVLTGAIWWWSMRLLLAGRVSWGQLAFPAFLTGAMVSLYTAGSGLVMARYVRAEAQQFGGLGVVLAVATWLVGFAGVMVVCAVLGRVVTEDSLIRGLLRRLGRGLDTVGGRAKHEGGHHGHEPVAEQPGAGDHHEEVQGAVRADHQEASGDHTDHATDHVPDAVLGPSGDQRLGQVGEPQQDQQ
jgi:membrane protein